MLINAANWGKTLDRAYQADPNNGANLLTVTAAHNLDTLSYCLGEFRELSAFAVSQRTHVPLQGTGEIIPFNVPDQIAVNGIAGDGAVVSFQARGGMWRGHTFLFEIHGEDGDLILTAPDRASSQRQELRLQGAQGTKAALADLAIPDQYRWVPSTTPIDSPYNVAQMYAKLGEAIRSGTPARPGFDDAVVRLRVLDAIRKASDTGERQVFSPAGGR
jgi:predicted dehydrogenase